MNEVQSYLSQKNAAVVEFLFVKAAPTMLELMLNQATWLVEKSNQPKVGDQSLKDLEKNGGKLSQIPLDSKNIKNFKKIAGKYGIGFSTTKDTTKSPPQHLVTFLAKDTTTMAAAFKEYLGTVIEKEKSQKPSFADRVKNAKEKVNAQDIDVEKNKNRGEVEGR